MPIQSRVPYAEYCQIPAVNISSLKELKRSPLHYQHLLANPKQSDSLTLGTAAHTATLEPERFARQFAVWSRRTDTGRMAPRNGQYWQAFCDANIGKDVLTEDECSEALAIAAAVRANPIAAPYLAEGDPEVTLEAEIVGRACKGRADWLHGNLLVGLKTARDCRPFPFSSVAARLGYHLQWAFYHDLFLAIRGHAPTMVEIVVESAPPHAVVVYRIPEDIIEQGRQEYTDLMDLLKKCEASGEWPGPAEVEQVLTLPTWVYGTEVDDVADLGLVTA